MKKTLTNKFGRGGGTPYQPERRMLLKSVLHAKGREGRFEIVFPDYQ
nr:MAG TPA: hypothetical protein [Caudoviricetes sp.]